MPTLARLALRPDVERLAGVRGVHWLGAGEFVRLRTPTTPPEVVGDEVRLGQGAVAVAVDQGGRRPLGSMP